MVMVKLGFRIGGCMPHSHARGGGRDWKSPYNIFIELILPCIIFRERVGPAGGPKYGAGANLVHYLYMLYIRAGLKSIGNCRKNR